MILNFYLEQTLENNRLLVQNNTRLEVKNQALMKIDPCFPYSCFNYVPRQPPELQNPIRDCPPSNSNTPPNITSATDKGKRAHFAGKVKEKYKRNDSNSFLRKLERKGYKD